MFSAPINYYINILKTKLPIQYTVQLYLFITENNN